ncbi:MAG: hypothetical protein CTY24_01180 [Methylobacter sp.]|nr:MAG: hypothetical protein CTY24_01180 [Methylobacter sp.]
MAWKTFNIDKHSFENNFNSTFYVKFFTKAEQTDAILKGKEFFSIVSAIEIISPWNGNGN